MSAGAGLVLGSGLLTPVAAEATDSQVDRFSRADPGGFVTPIGVSIHPGGAWMSTTKLDEIPSERNGDLFHETA